MVFRLISPTLDGNPYMENETEKRRNRMVELNETEREIVDRLRAGLDTLNSALSDAADNNLMVVFDTQDISTVEDSVPRLRAGMVVNSQVFSTFKQ